ncbi:glucose-6-phosphate dehydrogenase [Candidatus Peregrinibacteria bacterium]|nr:glucose-6-phosphate dehydrogenase [Candidatus Peregrinibacteria bacterium]
MQLYKIAKPFILTIFGASGDLAKIKLFPALYSLMEQKRLPKEFYIVGFARTEKSDKEFKKEFTDSIKENQNEPTDKKILFELEKHVYYFKGQYNDLKDFQNFKEYLKNLTGEKSLITLAYFSVPPIVFEDIIKNLGTTKEKNEDIRLIMEKPFGEDQKSAKNLFHFVARYFDEDSIYLLDHYLGKSSVQSILHLRHSNRILNLMMKGPEISNIQITAFEKLGVTKRTGYFDQVGTIKDMIQSHLMQILALLTMSIPITENTESLHREKYSILSALKFIESEKNIVLGQYEGYKKEKGIPKNSKTETFAAIRLFIDRESWYKTPIYIRTGKKLHEKHTYIVIELKKFAFQPKDEQPNRLIIELQPEEKINIRLVNKHGSSSDYQQITTSDSIACTGDDCLPEHGLLILDVIRKNHINFLSFEEIISTWKLTDSIVNFMRKNSVKIEKYKDESTGPESQNKLTEIDNFEWFDIH